MSDSRNWEGLLYDSTMAPAGGGDDDDLGVTAGAQEEEEEVNDKLVLADMPPSWVTRLHVPVTRAQLVVDVVYERLVVPTLP